MESLNYEFLAWWFWVLFMGAVIIWHTKVKHHDIHVAMLYCVSTTSFGLLLSWVFS